MDRMIVFLHGGTAGGWMWDPQIEAFPDRPTYAPDVPGYLSRREEEWVSFDAVADAVADLIAGRARGSVDLVGLSMGGILALHLAARHPHLVASAFVTGASVLPYTPAMRAGNAVAFALWNRRFYWAGLARTLGLDPEGTREFIEQSPAVTRRSALAQLREVEPGGVTNLERVAAPVLAVVGEKEPRYFHRSLREIRSRVPHAQIGVAPGMHHGWSGEDPDLFNRILRPWLDERARHRDLLRAG